MQKQNATFAWDTEIFMNHFHPKIAVVMHNTYAIDKPELNHPPQFRLKIMREQEMEAQKGRKSTNKSLRYYMRILHRDIGFLMIGLTLVFSLSGILLVYRQTDLLKSDTAVVRTLSSGLTAESVGKALHLRNLKVSSDDGRYILFSSEPSVHDGKYDRENGSVALTEKQLPTLLNKLNLLHKVGSANTTHWFSVIYGTLLMFLAVSSFWMFKPSTRQFRRGLALATGGVATAAALVAII